MRERTDYLRGLAILFVMLGHWIKGHVPHEWFIGGNGFVSIFFFLSGFGLYFSLSRIQEDRPLGLRFLNKFYMKRAARIYPLYWIGTAARFLLGFSHLSVTAMVLMILGIHFTDPPFLWFVLAIIQCYIIAPFAFQLLKKAGPLRFLILVLILVGVVNLLLMSCGVQRIRVWSYRGLFLNHIQIFCFGLAGASLSAQREQNGKAWASLALFALFLLVIVQQAYTLVTFPYKGQITGLALAATSSLFCMEFARLRMKPLLDKALRTMGVYSYSLYITHMYFYFCLRKFIGGAFWKQSLTALLLFPVFLLFVGLLESLVNARGNVNKALADVRRNFHLPAAKRS